MILCIEKQNCNKHTIMHWQQWTNWAKEEIYLSNLLFKCPPFSDKFLGCSSCFIFHFSFADFVLSHFSFFNLRILYSFIVSCFLAIDYYLDCLNLLPLSFISSIWISRFSFSYDWVDVILSLMIRLFLFLLLISLVFLFLVLLSSLLLVFISYKKFFLSLCFWCCCSCYYACFSDLLLQLSFLLTKF